MEFAACSFRPPFHHRFGPMLSSHPPTCLIAGPAARVTMQLRLLFSLANTQIISTCAFSGAFAIQTQHPLQPTSSRHDLFAVCFWAIRLTIVATSAMIWPPNGLSSHGTSTSTSSVFHLCRNHHRCQLIKLVHAVHWRRAARTFSTPCTHPAPSTTKCSTGGNVTRCTTCLSGAVITSATLVCHACCLDVACTATTSHDCNHDVKRRRHGCATSPDGHASTRGYPSPKPEVCQRRDHNGNTDSAADNSSNCTS